MYRRANGKSEFYSLCSGGSKVELFLDEMGMPTIDYPHVHVIHHASGRVDVLASVSRGNHSWRKTLEHAAGQEIEKVITEAARRISIKKIRLLCRGTEHGYVHYRHEDAKYRCVEIVWKGSSIPEVTVIAKDPIGQASRSRTLRLNELFEIDWGANAVHDLAC